MLWDALGALLGALEAPRAVLGALLGHSGGPLWCSLGALEAHLGPPEASGPPRGRFSEDFGSTWGSIWVGLVTEFCEFQERVGMRKYVHLETTYISTLVYIYI